MREDNLTVTNKHPHLPPGDPRLLWSSEERKHLWLCDQCGKQIYIRSRQMWGWYVQLGRNRRSIVCSYNCQRMREQHVANREQLRHLPGGLVYAKRVVGIDYDTHMVVKRFRSIAEAARFYGMSPKWLTTECHAHETDHFRVYHHTDDRVPLMMFETTYNLMKQLGELTEGDDENGRL